MTTSRIGPRGRPWLAAAALAAAAACSDGTGPGDERTQFDAQRVQAGIAAVERAGSSAVVEAFQGLGQHVGGAGVTGVAAPIPATGRGRLIGVIREIAGLVGPASGPALVPVIRAPVLGKTYVWDPASRTYVIDPARTGAPANGVRFILYEKDQATEQPNPAREIGYADLTDENVAAPNAVGLQLKVVSQNVTYLEYRFDLSGSIGSATSVVSGYLSDGTERVNFELATAGQLFGRGGTVTLDATVSVPSQRFSVAARVSGTAGVETGDGRVDLTVTAGTDVIDVEAETRANTLDATFTVNGRLLATATGDPEHPVIKGEGGRELTPEEMRALGAIVGLAQGLFELFAGLLAPAGVLLLLALGL
jgi:predicted kinase